MKVGTFTLPDIALAEQTPVVEQLLEVIMAQQKELEGLKEEIQKLKGQKGKPKLRSSKMDEATEPEDKKRPASKPSPKKRKTQQLKIDHTEIIKAEEVPAGLVFKGYEDYVVQELILKPDVTCYRLEQWRTPEGKYLSAQLPPSLQGRHYGPTLISYIVYQYHHQHVTQPLLLEQLTELWIEISSGQLSQLLTHGKEDFHQEKDAMLGAGIEVSRYLHSDDTGARHAGKNGYCTHIGNELFTWFSSTESKSRVNFLQLLRAEHAEYIINAGTLDYMAAHRLAQPKLAILEAHGGRFATKAQWQAHLEALGITGKRHVAIATEGALMGSLLAHGFPATMSIISDDEGQFNVFNHALCWIHAERAINRLIPLSDTHRKALAWVRTQIWDLYADLKAYKTAPDEAAKREINERFDELCTVKTGFETLNQALRRLHRNKAELLRVLEKPWLPLHNNLSERDIREYVKKRKISGSTRSEQGRRCGDTFASLKNTCRKHGISFWVYLKDRISCANTILPLPDIIRQAALAVAWLPANNGKLP